MQELREYDQQDDDSIEICSDPVITLCHPRLSENKQMVSRSVGLESGVFVNSRDFSLILRGFTDFAGLME